MVKFGCCFNGWFSSTVYEKLSGGFCGSIIFWCYAQEYTDFTDWRQILENDYLRVDLKSKSKQKAWDNGNLR